MSTATLLLSLVLGVMGAAEHGKDANARLKAHLRGWAEASDRAGPRHYTFRLTQEDRVYRTKQTWQGEVFLAKPSILRVDVKDTTGKMNYILFFDEKAIHFYDFSSKREMIYPFPAQRGFGETPVPKGAPGNWSRPFSGGL